MRSHEAWEARRELRRAEKELRTQQEKTILLQERAGKTAEVLRREHALAAAERRASRLESLKRQKVEAAGNDEFERALALKKEIAALESGIDRFYYNNT